MLDTYDFQLKLVVIKLSLIQCWLIIVVMINLAYVKGGEMVKEEVNYVLVLAENQRMETKRLVLRPVVLEDAPDMFEYASDEENVEFVFPRHHSVEDTRINIAKYFMENPLGKYGLELKESKKLIGTVDLRISEEHASAEVGYTLNKAYWGQGYVPEACEALLELGFLKCYLFRIASKHDIRNPRSGRVMEKIGMQKEGLIPNARIHKGQSVTDVIRGITIDEWKKRNEI
ncbi:N-acetyltransferase [Clostridia bacterium]|nr:N-acetyltransferase [Clostridia bacterium]